MRKSAVIGLAALLVLTGCGSKKAAHQPTAAEAAVIATVTTYSDDLVAGLGKKAFPLLSARCRTVLTAGGFDDVAAQAHATYPHVKLESVTVDDITSTVAHVSYTYDTPVLNQAQQPWLKEHGSWRWNAC